MSKPIFNLLLLRLIFPAIWVILTVAQVALVMYYLSGSSLYGKYVLFDMVIYSILQATGIFLLWFAVKYSRNILNFPLLLIFNILLFLIFSAACIGLGFLITNTFFSNYPHFLGYFLNILPVRIFFSLLIYAVFVLAYYLLLSNDELRMQKQKNEEKLPAKSLTVVEKLSRIIVKKNSEYHCVNVNQIRYIEANGDYVLIYTDTSKYLKDQTMKYWEAHLPDDRFVRIHRSFIVNVEVIARIELYEKEIYKVHLKNGDVLKASITGYKLLKQKMHL